MLVKGAFKKAAFKTLTHPVVNPFTRRLVRGLMKTFALDFHSALVSIPAVGQLRVELPDHKHFLMASTGEDRIASISYYLGAFGFEPETSSLYYQMLEAGMLVFDVGANTGNYSLMAAAKSADIEVHTFEPFPKVYDVLANNVKINGFEKIHLHQLALSDQPGEAILYVVPSLTLPKGSSLNPEQLKESFECRVPTMTLDGFAQENKIEKIDIVKLDTESTEPDILSGGRETILKYRPIVFCEVLNKKAAVELENFWLGQNYNYYWLRPEGPKQLDKIEVDESFGLRNYLFLPQEKQDKYAELIR